MRKKLPDYNRANNKMTANNESASTVSVASLISVVFITYKVQDFFAWSGSETSKNAFIVNT